ncbi:MAG: DnaJ family domain-containing protein [Betaproteobacteria bacterium]
MRSFDDQIAHVLREALDSGELATAESYGKPMRDDPAWEATPEALRMPMKILKDAGVIPREIEWFHERARLRARLESTADPDARRKLQVRLNELEANISLRLESLRINATL